MKANSNFKNYKGNVFSDMLKNPLFAAYRSAWANNPKDHIVGDFPLHLDIEITNRCNLMCPGCARTTNYWCAASKIENGRDNGFGDMSMNLYKRIIDEGQKNGLYSVKLSLRGEAMLHERLFDMIEYAFSKGIIDLYFNSNGTLLTEDACIKIVKSGMKRISFSFDGWDKESFEKYRKGAKYDNFVQGVDTLLSVRKKENSNYPKVRIQTVLFPEIEKHFDAFYSLWSEKADEIGSIDARREGKGHDHKGKFEGRFICPFLWQRMAILYDGTLLPCLMHGIKDYSFMSLGNVKRVSIKDQWLSKKMNEIRKAHIESRSHEILACDSCSYRACEIEKQLC